MKYEIPYEQLQLMGISRTVADSMPPTLMEALQTGELTPLVMIKRVTEDNKLMTTPIKLRMEDGADGNPVLKVYPMSVDMKNSLNVSEADFRTLKEGGIINVAGTLHMRDPETNCIISKTEKELDIDRRIAELEKVRDIELGTAQKTQLKEGKPVELDVGGEKVTVGLDLRDKDRFRTLNGDMKEWQRQQEIAYDIMHPEYVGIVQTDENRWEWEMIRKEGLNSRTVKERPAQTRSGGMKL